jgi:16S rRNA (uracil1498-N3)-methyltransferase
LAKLRRAWHEAVSGEGAEVTLDDEQSHHVVQVLRLRRGDALAVFDGRGREWDAELLDARRGGARIRVGSEKVDPVEAPIALTLFQGLCRPDRMEWVVQKATELGAHAIRPIATRRSECGSPSAERLDRWRRIAREAARQSGRRIVPQVTEVEPIPAPCASPTYALIVLLPDAGAPLAVLLSDPAPPAAGILVGPEGGLDPEEVAALEEGGFRGARLGPRTLRTETAGVVACALVLHAWGDLGSGRPPRRFDSRGAGS